MRNIVLELESSYRMPFHITASFLGCCFLLALVITSSSSRKSNSGKEGRIFFFYHEHGEIWETFWASLDGE